ncbi:hypothetical protein CBFG_05881 [Clostridiales bacterium 1_7_47FAA]|nr:hypothetical protein CBFG_05881 [Clostridiales bacterium 1_7_47FAA]
MGYAGRCYEIAEMKWDKPAFGIDIARCKVGMQFAFKISVKTFG